MLKSGSGLYSWCKKFERVSLEKYYIIYFSISLFDCLYTILRETIHVAPIQNRIFSSLYFAIVFHFVSVTYSLLHNVDELYRFWKMKKHEKKKRKYEQEIKGEIDFEFKHKLAEKFKKSPLFNP